MLGFTIVRSHPTSIGRLWRIYASGRGQRLFVRPIPARSHFLVEFADGQPEHPSHELAVSAVQDHPSPLPIPPSPRVYTELPRCLTNRPSHGPALREQTLREARGLWERVVPQEPDDGRQEPDWRLGTPFLPVQDRPRRRSIEVGSLPLAEPALEAAMPEMLAQGLGLDRRFLWFQALKDDGDRWQKGNASLQLRLSGRFVGEMPLHARPDRSLSSQDFRTVARSHRHQGRGAAAAGVGVAGRFPCQSVGSDSRARLRRARAAARAARKAERVAARRRNRAPLRARGSRGGVAEARDRAALALGARVSPGTARRAHDCGSGGCRHRAKYAHCRGDSVPAARRVHVRRASGDPKCRAANEKESRISRWPLVQIH